MRTLSNDPFLLISDPFWLKCNHLFSARPIFQNDHIFEENGLPCNILIKNYILSKMVYYSIALTFSYDKCFHLKVIQNFL